MALGRQTYTNPTREIKQPGAASLCHWIKTAWQWINPGLVAKGKCCIPDSWTQLKITDLEVVESRENTVGRW